MALVHHRYSRARPLYARSGAADATDASFSALLAVLFDGIGPFAEDKENKYYYLDELSPDNRKVA
jgi:hypothetical protein